MRLPERVSVSAELALQMARRNGSRVESARVLLSAGIINTVIALDDQLVLQTLRRTMVSLGEG